MNKKLIFILIIIITVILIIIVVPIYLKNITIKKLEDRSTTVLENWGTFENESSDDYLNSLKPFFTNDLYEQYVKDANSLKELILKYEGTVDSKTEVDKVKYDNFADNTYVFIANIIRKSEVLNKTTKEQIQIQYTKVDSNWMVSSINVIKQQDAN